MFKLHLRKINLMKKILYTTFFATLLIMLFTGCDHDKSCKAVIKVVDIDGVTLVGDAKVQLFANVSTASGPVVADLKAEGVTASDGTVEFKFKLPAILDVKAIKGVKVATGIIKLEEKETVQKTVQLQ
jgi:hypothetical protein